MLDLTSPLSFEEEAQLLDPSWAEDEDRWTFVSGMAYLNGSMKLVDPRSRSELEAMPDAESDIRRQLHDTVQINTGGDFPDTGQS